MTALAMMMEFRCWTKVENYLPVYWSEKRITFLEKRHLTRSKETKDLENPEDRTCTDGNKVTPVSKNFYYGHNV